MTWEWLKKLKKIKTERSAHLHNILEERRRQAKQQKEIEDFFFSKNGIPKFTKEKKLIKPSKKLKRIFASPEYKQYEANIKREEREFLEKMMGTKEYDKWIKSRKKKR